MIRSGVNTINIFKRVRVFGVLFFGLIPVLSTSLYGCTRSDEDTDPVLLVTEETEEDVAGNLPVEYTDVVSTISIGVKYRTAATQDLSFDVERAKIDSVLVTPGETVRAGQLLITLETDVDIEAEREDLLYQIDRLNLLILQVEHQIEYEKTLARFDHAMDTPITDEKNEKLEEKLQAIDDKYYFTLQDYEDQITICNLKLYNLENNNNDHNIYAGMDGIVEYVREGLEGSQTVIGRTVITIKDPDDMYFYASDVGALEYLEGMPVIKAYGLSGAQFERLAADLDIDLVQVDHSDYAPRTPEEFAQRAQHIGESFEEQNRRKKEALQKISEIDILSEGGIIICERPREKVMPAVVGDLICSKDYCYGKTAVNLYTR